MGNQSGKPSSRSSKGGPKKIKKNDGSSSLGLDDEEEEVVGEVGRATMPMKNRQVMGNKREKGWAARDAAVSKMSVT